MSSNMKSLAGYNTQAVSEYIRELTDLCLNECGGCGRCLSPVEMVGSCTINNCNRVVGIYRSEIDDASLNTTESQKDHLILFSISGG